MAAGSLLEAGAAVWISHIVAYSLVSGSLDDGGSVTRALDPGRGRDFTFPQELNPEVVVGGWRPEYIDYLYVGHTSATAFSPTDAMPLAASAKSAMTAQSFISLVILGLVIARAVNIFN